MKQTTISLYPFTLLLLLAFVLGAACARTPATPLAPTLTPVSSGEVLEATPPPDSESPQTTVIVENPQLTPVSRPETILPTIPNNVLINVLLPEYSEYFKTQMLAQFAQFSQAYPTIKTELDFASPADIRNRLEVSRAAGILPTLTLTGFNELALLADKAEVLPFDAYPSLFWERYLPASIDGVAFNNQFYGVPWFRDTCSPAFYNLVILQGTEDQVIAAHLLAEFLTDYNLEKENLFNLNLFPSRADVYNNGVVGCPETGVVLPPVNLVNLIVEGSQADRTTLASLSVSLNPIAATALTSNMLGQTAEPSVLARLTPAEIADQLYNNDLVFGAFQTDDPQLAAKFSVPPGVYLITCAPDSETQRCNLISPEGAAHSITPAVYTKNDFSTNYPGVFIEQAASSGCFYLNGLKMCLDISR